MLSGMCVCVSWLFIYLNFITHIYLNHQVIHRLLQCELCLVRSSRPCSDDQKSCAFGYDIRHSHLPTREYCIFRRRPQGGYLKRRANRCVSHCVVFLIEFYRIYRICGFDRALFFRNLFGPNIERVSLRSKSQKYQVSRH